MKMHGRFFVRLLPGVLLGLVIVAVGAVEGQSTTAASLSNEPTNSSSPIPITSTSSSPDLQNQTNNNNGANVSDGQALYDACNQRKGVICYGDKSNCIKTRSCTFLGAIAENETSINVTVLTRVYNPPYDGVNLTVELQRDNKGNGSMYVCDRPRFKSFKIRLSWKNKTNFEPGNETQLAQTLIDKDQLKNECLSDQIKNNFTIPPSQTLALKFYIMNNNTLVSQGLTHIDVQETTRKPDAAQRNRTGKCLGDLCAAPATDPPQPVKNLQEQKEDALYEMCTKNTAHCFGDTLDCTNGHNCTLLGVIKENLTNYVVYLVSKSFDPPLSDLNVTLTLQAPYTVGNSSNSTDGNAMKQDGCQKLDFKDLQVQTIWRDTDLSHPASTTNVTMIREAVLDKNRLRNRCNFDIHNLTSTNGTDMVGDLMNDYINYYLHFHLENDTLVPGDISTDLEIDSDMMELQNAIPFIVGQNGTATLVGENNDTVIPMLHDVVTSSSATAPDSNASPSVNVNYFSCLSVLIATFVVLFSK